MPKPSLGTAGCSLAVDIMNEQDMMWQKTLRFRRQSIAIVALEVSSKYVAALFKLPRERPAPVPSEGGPKYYWEFLR